MSVPGYAIAHVHSVDFGADIVEYLEKIDATMDPYEGRFLTHGGFHEVREGDWGMGVIVIQFPSIEAARAWYDSPEYQEILPLRTKNMVADVIIAAGEPAGYRGADSLKKLLG